MALKLKHFDASKYVDTPEAQAAFLSEALLSGDAGHVAKALGVVARARGISGLAAETGLNRATLYAALSEDGNPTLDTVLKVAMALGLDFAAKPHAEEKPVRAKPRAIVAKAMAL